MYFLQQRVSMIRKNNSFVTVLHAESPDLILLFPGNKFYLRFWGGRQSRCAARLVGGLCGDIGSRRRQRHGWGERQAILMCCPLHLTVSHLACGCAGIACLPRASSSACCRCHPQASHKLPVSQAAMQDVQIACLPLPLPLCSNLPAYCAKGPAGCDYCRTPSALACSPLLVLATPITPGLFLG